MIKCEKKTKVIKMKLPQTNIENMSNEQIMNIKMTIEREIKRRIEFLNETEHPEMEGLSALFGY